MPRISTPAHLNHYRPGGMRPNSRISRSGQQTVSWLTGNKPRLIKTPPPPATRPFPPLFHFLFA